jgi:hypothetical protein
MIMTRIPSLILLCCLAIPISLQPAVAAPDAQALLEASDQARGGRLPGIVWQIDLSSKENGRMLEERQLEVSAVVDASVAETIKPARFRGSKLLQVGRNMWLTRPGLSKPVPISPRQRMSGQAANGDIAATNYAANYHAESAGTEIIDGELCRILELTANNKRTTYDRIRYWIAEDRKVGVKAEFYSLSGKLLKSASFEYNLRIEYEDQSIPFVSSMVITDALTDSFTVLEYSSVEAVPVPATMFDLGQM